jgi:hypothetical protein
VPKTSLVQYQRKRAWGKDKEDQPPKVLHFQHPADIGAEEYRKVASRATLCWNMRVTCVKTTNAVEVTCKHCLKILALRYSRGPSSTNVRGHTSHRREQE